MDKAASGAQSFQLDRQFRISYNGLWLFYVLVDIALIMLSDLGASYLYNTFFNPLPGLHSPLGVGAFVAIIYILIAKNINLYELTHLLDPSKCFSKISLAWATTILLVTAMFFLFRVGTEFSRLSTASFAVLGFAALISVRLFSAPFLRSFIKQGSISGRRALIIGDRDELEHLSSWSLLLNFGLREVGRISFSSGSDSQTLSKEDLSKLDYAILVARQQGVEELAIAFDWSQPGLIQKIGERLRISPLPVRLLPDRVVSSFLARRIFSTTGPIPSVELQRAPLSRSERFAKRFCDVLLAAIALIFLAPLMIIAAILIKLDSPGPVIFRQRRTGFNGQTFFINKFRTMSVMEDGPQITQTRRDDPRVTRVGKFLRESSIDELPQIFNVLKGDMSLVGPRPHALAHDDHYGTVISSYAYRHHVKPGITGWAQINGRRGETQRVEDMEKRIDLDLWYINNWSILLDLKIIWRTSFELLQHRAY